MAISNEDYTPSAKYGGTWATGDIADSAITTAKINTEAVTGVKLATGEGFFVVAKETGATTTEQSLFGTSGLGVACTITGFHAYAMDSTAVTVALNAGTASVGTVVLSNLDGTGAAKGPDAELGSNSNIAATDNIFVQNDQDGKVLAVVTFQIG